MFKEKYIKTRDNLNIFTESVGDYKNPTVILIMGAMNQGLFWYDSFCQKISDAGFFVVRFDHRDTGLSSVVNYKENPYNLDGLANDVLDVLSAYNIDKVHIIGLSMGGYIGQIIGANYPEKVKTLTLISTTADHRPYMDATMGNFNNKYNLSYPKQIFLDCIENSKNNPPQSEEDAEKFQIEGWKVMFGKISDYDFEEVVKLIKLANKRSKDKYSAFNHGLAVLNSKERTDLVKNIRIPTFIFHGENDPCLPIDHGELLNILIPNSKLDILKSMGHMFSLTESDILLNKILSSIK
jgi:pimeloyl-ACP methyl ester carboxylesterase